MSAIGELKNELDDMTTMGFIAQAFTEAAATHIQKIRTAFEKNKQFYEEVCSLYHLVRVSCKKEGKVQGSGKTLSVAITSNQRFYGNINISIMQTFIEETAKHHADILVVGSTGNSYMESSGDVRKFEKRIFHGDSPTPDEATAFLDYIKPYETVILYYPKFVTLMTQTVGKTDITQALDTETKVSDDEINILFEPDSTNILEFFTRQVRALLFLRVMLEADLARTAARLLTMSMAEERSREMMKLKKSQIRKVQTSITNAKLLETFSAMKGWKREDS